MMRLRAIPEPLSQPLAFDSECHINMVLSDTEEYLRYIPGGLDADRKFTHCFPERIQEASPHHQHLHP